MNQNLIGWSSIVLTAVSCTCVSVAKAADLIIYNNFDGIVTADALGQIYRYTGPPGTGPGNGIGMRYGVPFVPSQTVELGSLTAQVAVASMSGSSTDFQLSLYSSSDGAPGTSLLDFPTIDTFFDGSVCSFTATTAGLRLDAGTTYWVVGQPSLSTDSDFWWAFGTDDTKNSRGENILNNSHDAWTASWSTINSGQPSLYLVGTAAVPEPSHYAGAVGLGLIGFGLWRRRSRDS